MRLIDSHAHLDFDDFHDDFHDVLDRANETGVKKIINIGADLNRSTAAVSLADTYPHIFATVGIHPDDAEEVNFETIHNDLLSLAKSSEKVVGIGECGLDYNQSSINNQQSTEATTKEKQKRLFQIHIDVAKHLNLPLVIHIRNGEDDEAVNDAYEILKKHKTQNTKHEMQNAKHKTEITKHKNAGVIHCFTLNSEWARRFSDLGYHIGFTGIITYKKTDEVREAVQTLPLEKILIETDCPFLAPQKYRGKRNEPAYVIEIAKMIAEIRGITLQEVAEATTMNAEKLFKLG